MASRFDSSLLFRRSCMSLPDIWSTSVFIRSDKDSCKRTPVLSAFESFNRTFLSVWRILPARSAVFLRCLSILFNSLDLARILQTSSRMPANVWACPQVATRRTDLAGGLCFKDRANSSRVARLHASSAPGEYAGIKAVLS